MNADVCLPQSANEVVAVGVGGAGFGLALTAGRRLEVVIGVLELMDGRPLCRQLLPHLLLMWFQQIPALASDAAEVLLTALHVFGDLPALQQIGAVEDKRVGGTGDAPRLGRQQRRRGGRTNLRAVVGEEGSESGVCIDVLSGSRSRPLPLRSTDRTGQPNVRQVERGRGLHRRVE